MDSSYEKKDRYISDLEQKKQNAVMSVKDWVITLILTAIPIVGLTLIIIWAFGTEGNKNRRNYSLAILICLAICVVIYILIVMSFGIFFWHPFMDEI